MSLFSHLLVFRPELWSRCKNNTAPALELLFYEHGCSSRALGFHECGSSSRAVFFNGGSSFCLFSQINIFNCLGVPQVESKMNQIKYTKLSEYTKLFEEFNLVDFHKHHVEISKKTTITGSDDSENSYQHKRNSR